MKIKKYRFILIVLVLSFFLVAQFSFLPLQSAYSKTNVISGDQVIDIELTKEVNTPGPYYVGDRVSFTVTVKNVGTEVFNANGVKVYDPEMKNGSPDFGDVVALPSRGWNGPNGKWVIGNIVMYPGDEISLILTGTLLHGGEICNWVYFVFSAQVEHDDNPGNDVDHKCIYVVEPDADIYVYKTCHDITPGDTNVLAYTITVGNDGPSDALNVVLTDALPSGLSNATYAVGGTSQGTWTGSHNFGTIASGVSHTVTIYADVSPSITTIGSNTATVASDTADANTVNNSDTCTNTITTDADIYVYKTCHDITPGDTNVLAYTITVGNDGPSDALNVVLTDALPSGLSNATYAVGGTSQGNWTGSHNFGTIASGVSHTVTIYADVSPSITTIGSNTATVASDTADANTVNNSDTCTNTITTDADIYVYKTCHDITPGDTNVLAYTITVGNDGPSDALNVVLTDALPSGLSNATYAVGGTSQGTWTGSHNFGTIASGVSHTVTIYADVSPSITTIGSNTATVASDTADANTANNSDTCTNTVTTDADIYVYKTCHDITPGDTKVLAYTITVGNDGPSDALNVVLTDALPSGLSNATYAVGGTSQGNWTGSHNFGTIASGVSHTVTIYADVSPSITTIGSNTATVASDTADANTVNNSDTCTNTITTDADIYVYKTCHDITPGDTNVLAYTITVGNDGPSDALNVVLTDALPSGLSNATYAVGGTSQGTWTGSHNFGTIASGVSHTVTIYADVSPSITTIGSNTATVASDTADANTANNSDTCTNTVTTDADIYVYKTCHDITPGDTNVLAYTITVGNDGPSDALNVVLTDALPSGLSNATYAVGGTNKGNWTGSHNFGTIASGVSHTVTIYADVSPSITTIGSNTAAVASDTADANTVNNSDTCTNTVTYTSSISITKVADITLAAVGDTITYTYTVTNTGDVTLTGITVNDDKLGGITLGATTLAPGASTTGTATYTVQESDLPGPIVNIATATGIDPDENSVTDTASESVTLEQPDASISITKVADITLAAVGDTITYTYTVTNNGNVTLNSITVNDDKLGSITLGATTLAPGASTTGTATYTVVEADLPGPIVNIATATGIDPFENSVTDTASESVTLKQPSLPSISLKKVADITLAAVEDTITYTYTVTNNGNVTLNSITVNDNKLGSITLGATTLTPGASTTGTATYTVVEADLPGPIVNIATATGIDPDENSVTDNASERVSLVQPGSPSISITKVANTALAAVGDTITYTYTITNTGDTVLNNITVNDDKLGSITLGATTLAPGASTTGTATYTVVEADLPGPIVNVAIATGIDPGENSVTDSASESVSLVQPAPSISITKVANTALAAVGDTITYTYTITNTGDTVLNNITVNDDKLGSITLGATTLAPGASTTGTATYTVQESDLPGPIVNVATATGIDPDENSVTDSDTASVALSSPQPLPEEEIVVYHHNFFSGYPDKTFRSENSITRAEVSSSVARSLGLKWLDYGIDIFSYSFPDVTDLFWGFGHVEALFGEKLIIGYPDGSFGPNRSITRAEAAQIFFRLLNLEPKYPATPTFSDIDSSHWAYGAVEAIAEREIILGYPDGTFKPDKPITRAEFVTIACKALGRGPFDEGIIENPYPDLKSTHWAFSFIMEASIPHVVLNPLRQDILIVIPSKKIPIYSEWADSTIEVPELGSIIIAIVPVDGLTPAGNDPPPREVIVKIIVKREMP